MRKLLFLLITAPLWAQECTYTIQHAPGGSIIVHRNGVALEESDYTRTGTGGARTITLNGWNDQDRIMVYYSYGVQTTVPGTSPPSKITTYLPTKEYHTCTGTLNPPAPPPFVPYSGANQDIDLGPHNLKAQSLTTGDPSTPTPSRIGLTAGSKPTDTLMNGVTQDGVLYLDSTTSRLGFLPKVPPTTFDATADERFTAADGQTSFALTHPPKSVGCVWVWKNGVRLYTETGQWSLLTGNSNIGNLIQTDSTISIVNVSLGDYIQIVYIWTAPAPPAPLGR